MRLGEIGLNGSEKDRAQVWGAVPMHLRDGQPEGAFGACKNLSKTYEKPLKPGPIRAATRLSHLSAGLGVSQFYRIESESAAFVRHAGLTHLRGQPRGCGTLHGH